MWTSVRSGVTSLILLAALGHVLVFARNAPLGEGKEPGSTIESLRVGLDQLTARRDGVQARTEFLRDESLRRWNEAGRPGPWYEEAMDQATSKATHGLRCTTHAQRIAAARESIHGADMKRRAGQSARSHVARASRSLREAHAHLDRIEYALTEVELRFAVK